MTASSLQPAKGRDYRALMANLRMVEAVIGALEKKPCAHLICLSSDAVYDALMAGSKSYASK